MAASQTPAAEPADQTQVESAAPAEPALRCRVLPKGDGEIHTGRMLLDGPETFSRGDVIEGLAPAIAEELEARGFVEIQN